MSSFLIGLALIVLIAAVTSGLGALAQRLAARLDGGRPGRVAAELRPDAVQPQARLHGEAAAARAAQHEPLRRLTVLELEGQAPRDLTVVGLR